MYDIKYIYIQTLTYVVTLSLWIIDCRLVGKNVLWV